MPLKKKKKAVKRKAIKRKPAKKRVAARKKVAPKKAARKKAAPKKPAVKGIKGTLVGTITHYFPHVRAAVVKVSAPFAVGDTVKIKGHTTEFKQVITSMQIDRSPIQKTKKGDEIGLLVQSRVRRKDTVYKA